MITGAVAVTVSVKGFEAVCGGEFASRTRTVKLNVPVAVGVPLIAPVAALSDNPAGSAPAVTVQLE